jgi:hypothetical protein
MLSFLIWKNFYGFFKSCSILEIFDRKRHLGLLWKWMLVTQIQDSQWSLWGFTVKTSIPRSKRPQVKTSPTQVKTSPGQNVPRSKRPQVKTSPGQNVSRSKRLQVKTSPTHVKLSQIKSNLLAKCQIFCQF